MTSTLEGRRSCREIGLEIAIAVREAGAMLISWEQSDAVDKAA